MTKATVLGSGSWGTAFAKILVEAGTEVTVLSRSSKVAKEIEVEHTNSEFLPDLELPPMRATTDYREAFAGTDIAVIAVPSQTVRENLEVWKDVLEPQTLVLSLAKGIENNTLLRMTQVIAQVTGIDHDRVAALSGPNLAREIAAGQPALTVVACTDSGNAIRIQKACATKHFRPYTNSDVIGVEIGGACKNVIAIACGMAAGRGMGDNTIASIITRGLAEIIRLGVAMGAQPGTLSGLAGVGDLVATCVSPLSRNHSFGQALGQGGSMEAAQEATRGQVAEGVKSSISIRALADAYDVDMPLSTAVHRVCHEGLTVDEAVDGLLGRQHKPE